VRASELNIDRNYAQENRHGLLGNLEYRMLNIIHVYLDGGAASFVGERVSIKCVSVLIKSKQLMTKICNNIKRYIYL
jgi:hypothetical protein